MNITCDFKIPYYIKRENVFIGEQRVFRICCMAKKLKELYGEDFVEIVPPDYPKEDWDESELKKKKQYDKEEIEKYKEENPNATDYEAELNAKKYQIKPIPSWLKQRLSKKVAPKKVL